MDLKRILVISDTYSLPKYPAKGLYVKEQALCLVGSGKCQIDVLFIDRKSKPFIICWFLFFKRIIKRATRLDTIESLEKFKVLYFLIPINRRMPDHIQLWIEKIYLRFVYHQYLKQNPPPDIIHAHSGLSSGIYANFLSEYFNCPFVITEHSPLMFHFVSKARGELVIESFKRARFVASLTIFQERLLKRVCSEAISQVIPNVINEDVFHIKNGTCGDFPFTIISVLYPNPVKGRRYLFNSFKILKEKGVEFKFVIVGEGIEKMKKECEILGIKDNGEFYFNLNKEELCSLYNKSHLYCCSSIYETFGLAAREAMLCGLPVVTTDNGGVVDSVTEDTGLIVPVQDSNALAEAIVSIKDNYNNYDPNTIRNTIINQSGTEVFQKKMFDFYGIDVVSNT